MNAKNVFSKIGLALALGMLVAGIFSGFFTGFLSVIAPNIVNSGYFNFILIGVSNYMVGIPLMLLILKSIPNAEKTESRKLSFKEVMTFFFISYALMMATNLITIQLLNLVSVVKQSEVVNPLEQMISSSNLLGTFLLTGICAPIFEELLFRGILINKLRGYGDKVAILTTAILFGLFHGNFSQFFYTVVLGIIFAYVALKSGSIKYTILLHMMINIMGGVVPLMASQNNITLMIFGLCIYVFLAVGIGLFIKNRKKISLSKGTVELEKGTVFKTTCLNIGMIIFFLLTFSNMISVLLA